MIRNDRGLAECSIHMLDLIIQMAIDQKDTWWFLRGMREKHNRYFNKNGEIDD